MFTTRELIAGDKLTRHLLFCIAVVVVLALGVYLFYIAGFRFGSTAMVSLNCVFFLLQIYTGRWLCNRWYHKQQLLPLVVYALAATIAIDFADFLLMKYAFNHPDSDFVEFIYGSMPFYLVGLITGVLLKMVSFSVQKEIREAQIKADQKESEFNLLQSQLSPHFLFNVLNSLYGISIDEHERIPTLLLKLSSLLRYSVYGAKKQFVPLKDELEYIQNYIGFEQIRISDRLRLTTNIEPINNPQIKIAPLVLIVFVENAFKHAKNTLTPEIDIHLSLKITGNFIRFTVSNSYQTEKADNVGVNEGSGLGLENTIKRLGLLYGTDYKLEQMSGNGQYHVDLMLKIMVQ
ncbi:MAG TPA: histidine kinase [Mucilaginibacter sp.]|nr:histidine kinase [Mucilaginibacter sp.]